MGRRVDLNADMGESYGRWTLGDDAALMPHLTSANIACGFHGGDPHVMRTTVALALEHGVGIGAHVGLPDLLGFGRRRMAVSAQEIEDYVLYQAGAMRGYVEAAGGRLQHVKPHGALFNMAARDGVLASAIARAVAAFDRQLILFGPPDSELVRAGETAGLRVAAEGFADRAYEPDGSLVSRTKPGAVITEAEEVVQRAVKIARDHSVVAVNGATVSLRVETLCVHSDTEGADVLASRLRAGLEAAGIRVVALSR